MPDQVITVRHGEDYLAPSPQESFDVDGQMTVVRTLNCAWEDRLLLATQLLGGPYDDGGGTDPVVFNPHQYPSRPTARATSITSIRGFGAMKTTSIHGATFAHYEKAKLVVVYTEAPETGGDTGPGGQANIEENFKPSGEFISLTNTELYWDNNTPQNEPVGDVEAPSIFVPRAEFSVKLRKLSVIPLAALTLYGKTNSAAITSPKYNLTFAAESLLYEGLHFEDVRLPNGNLGHDVTYHFLWNPFIWNRFYKASNTTPQPLYSSNGTQLTGANGFAPTGSFAAILPGVFF